MIHVYPDAHRAVGKANINAHYGPHQTLEAAQNEINSSFTIIPTGLTFAVGSGSSLKEYWWNGEEFVLKINSGSNGGNEGSTSDPPDFTPVYEAIEAGDAALEEEIQGIIADINTLKPKAAKIDTIETRSISNKNRLDTLEPIVAAIQSAGSGNQGDQDQSSYSSSKFLVIYSNSSQTPTGGSYNFTTNVFVPPTGWSTTVPSSGTPYFSFGTAYSTSPNNITWSIPSLLITDGESLLNGIASSKTYPAQIYTSENQPNVPSGITFDTNTKQIVIPNGSIWRESPADSNGSTDNVWVSFNNYIITDGQSGYEETGWTTPRLFVDIDTILSSAAAEAEQIAQRNLQQAQQNINNAITSANNKIYELNTLKTQLQENVDSAISDINDKSDELDTLSQQASETIAAAKLELESAKTLMDNINNGDASVGGLLTEVSKLRGETKQYGWSADTEITNYHWELDGTTVNNIPSLENSSNKLMLNDIHHVNNIYFILDRFSSGEYKLYKTDQDGVKEVSNDSYITVTYDGGNFVPNDSSVTSVLICKGTPVTGNINYTESFKSAAEGVIYDKVTNATTNRLQTAIRSMTSDEISDQLDDVIFWDDQTEFNTSVRTQSAAEIYQRVYGQTTNKYGNNTIETSLIDQSKKAIKLEVTGSETGNISTTIFNLAKDYIDGKVTSLQSGELNQTTIHMSPEQIVLSALGSDNVVQSLYTEKGGTKVGQIGNTYKLLEEDGKKYVYSGTGANIKYYVISGSSLSSGTSTKTEFDGYIGYEILNNSSAEAAVQEISKNQIKQQVWGTSANQHSDSEIISAAIRDMTKDYIKDEVSSTQGGTFKTALVNLTNSLITQRVTEFQNGEINQTQMRMTPTELVLSAIGSSDLEYILLDEKDGTRLSYSTYLASEYTWDVENDVDYFYTGSGPYTYYYADGNSVSTTSTKTPFGGYIDFSIRNNADVKGSFINLMKDSLSLSVANSNGQASIVLKVTEDGQSYTNIASDQVTITGTMIADAIVSNGVNIANKTYLNRDGSVQLGMGTGAASLFDTDGTGYIAGGLITWGKSGNNFQLSVDGIVNATGGIIGGWTIAQNCLNSNVSGNYITLSPTSIYSGNIAPSGFNASNIGWALLNDGSGWLAKNKINWGTDGYGTINNQLIWNANAITVQTPKYSSGSGSTLSESYVKIEGTLDGNNPKLVMATCQTASGVVKNDRNQLTFTPNLILLGASRTAQITLDDTPNNEALTIQGGSSEAHFSSLGISLTSLNSGNSGAKLIISNSYLPNSTTSSNSAYESVILQSLHNGSVSTYLHVSNGDILISNTSGGQVLVDSYGVHINSSDDSTTPYITVQNTSGAKSVGIYSNSNGNRINVTSSDIQILGGSLTSTKSAQIIDSNGIRLYASAQDSGQNIWTSSVTQNINEKGIGLFAEYNSTGSGSYNDSISALIVAKGTGNSTASGVNANTSRLTAGINSETASKGRVALVSGNLDNSGLVTSLNAFLSVNDDGIYGGGNNFVFGSNAGSKLYIQDNQNAAIVLGKVNNASSPGSNTNDCFIAFYKDTGKVQLKSGSTSSPAYIEITSSGIQIGGSGVTINSDVNLPNSSVTATSLIAKYGGTTYGGLDSNMSSASDTVLWAGGTKSNAKFKVAGNGNLTINGNAIKLNYDGSGQLASGNIVWDENGNGLFVTGTTLNQVTDYSSLTYGQDTTPGLTGSGSTCKIDPNQLGNVVLLPRNATSFILPHYYYSGGVISNFSASDLRKMIGRKIYFYSSSGSVNIEYSGHAYYATSQVELNTGSGFNDYLQYNPIGSGGYSSNGQTHWFSVEICVGRGGGAIVYCRVVLYPTSGSDFV